MPQRRERIRVYAFGKLGQFRFFFDIYKPKSTRIFRKDITNLKTVAQCTARSIFAESRANYYNKYAGYLPPIRSLHLSNGMEIAI